MPVYASGQQPTLDTSGELISENDDYQSARVIIDHLKKHIKDLDGHLSQSDLADLTAFRTLVQTCLEPASLCTMWLEAESYSKHTQVTYLPSCSGLYQQMSPKVYPLSALSVCCCKRK